MKKILVLLLLSSCCFASGPKYSFSDPRLNDELDNIYKDIGSSLKGNVLISSVTITSATITSAIIVGSTSGSAPCTGCVGEVIESVAGVTNFPATVTWGDLTSIPLTAGNWSVSFVAEAEKNTSNSTYTAWNIGISANSGTSSTGLTKGSNSLQQLADVTNGNDTTQSIPNFHVLLAASATYYAKILAVYAAGQPRVYGRITAIRIQ